MAVQPVVWVSESRLKDSAIVGNKGANLGELYNLKFPVPNAFIVTAQSYEFFLNKTGIQEKINSLLSNINVEDSNELQIISQKIQELILDSQVPNIIKESIIEAYDDMNVDRAVSKALGSDVLNTFIKAGRDLPFVAVRPSIIYQDSEESTNLQYYLNVRGKEDVVLAVQKCWASLFSSKSIYYKIKNKIPLDNSIAVIVQRMVNSDKSGIMFTFNPETSDESERVIEAVFGLGDVISNKELVPDNYIINKQDLIIKSKKISKQEFGKYRDQYTGKNIKRILDYFEGNKQKLSEEEILKLIAFCNQIESHFKKPLVIEWAIEGNKLSILQSKVVSIKKPEVIQIQQETQSQEEQKPQTEVVEIKFPEQIIEEIKQNQIKNRLEEQEFEKQPPIIETNITLSKDGNFLIHKTTITNIKPVNYYKRILENN